MKRYIRSSSKYGEWTVLAKSWKDLIQKLKEHNVFIDSGYTRKPERYIVAYFGGPDNKTGEPVIIEVNKYYGGEYEVLSKNVHPDLTESSI